MNMKNPVSRKAILCLTCIFLLGCVLLGSGCTDTGNNETSTSDAAVKAGDLVSVDYVGKLENGTVFDTSIKETAIEAGIYNEGRDKAVGYKPLNFTVGAKEMIKGFDDGVVGMKVGEEKNITIPPEEAYGEYKEEMVQAVPLENLGLETPPIAGQKLQTIYGTQITVREVNETHAILDLNHELAGKTLTFDIKLVSLK